MTITLIVKENLENNRLWIPNGKSNNHWIVFMKKLHKLSLRCKMNKTWWPKILRITSIVPGNCITNCTVHTKKEFNNNWRQSSLKTKFFGSIITHHHPRICVFVLIEVTLEKILPYELGEAEKKQPYLQVPRRCLMTLSKADSSSIYLRIAESNNVPVLPILQIHFHFSNYKLQ